MEWFFVFMGTGIVSAPFVSPRTLHKVWKGREMKRIVKITLDVPDDFTGSHMWTAEQCLESLVSHWLEEGYYVHDHLIELPDGIEYEGFTIEEGGKN